MANRKRTRKLKNTEIKNNLRAFSDAHKKHKREREEAEMKEQLGRARLLYDEFKRAMTESGPAKTWDEILVALEALKDAIKKVCKNKFVRNAMMREVNLAEHRFLTVYGPKSKTELKTRMKMPHRDDVDGGGDPRNN